MYGWEDRRGVLEVQQTHQRLRLHEIAEEEPRGVIRRDAGGDDESGPAASVDGLAHEFGEHLVGVDVASAAQRVAAGVAQHA